MRTALLIKVAALVIAFGFVSLTPRESQAQLSFEITGKVGMASATPDDTAAGDPVFNIGGGGQFAVLLRFAGGIQAGLNFNFNAESHVNTGTNIEPRPTYTYLTPSVGIKAGFDLMPQLNVAAWANFAFGSGVVDLPQQDATFGIQGFEIGAEAKLNYQLKPYKTYILFGIYGYYQFLQMFVDTPGVPAYGDHASSNLGIGALLGIRFDISI